MKLKDIAIPVFIFLAVGVMMYWMVTTGLADMDCKIINEDSYHDPFTGCCVERVCVESNMTLKAQAMCAVPEIVCETVCIGYLEGFK